jgi:hypothetical protein
MRSAIGLPENSVAPGGAETSWRMATLAQSHIFF